MARPTAIVPAHDRLSHLNMLVYGFPGARKSALVGSAAEVGKTLVLECGQGEVDTMVSFGYDPDVWEITELDQLTEAYEYMRHEGCDVYDFVVWDSVTGFESRYMKNLMKTVSDLKDNRNIDVPDKPEYMKVQNAIDRFVSYFIDLPINFICTAHVMIGENVEWDEENNGFTEVQLMLPQIQGVKGKIAQKVAANMNVVAYMEVDKHGIPSIRIQSDPGHLAKDRFGCLANTKDGRMLNPTVPKIMSAIEAKRNGKKPVKGVTKKVMPVKKVVGKKSTTTKKTSKQVASPSASKAARLRKG